MYTIRCKKSLNEGKNIRFYQKSFISLHDQNDCRHVGYKVQPSSGNSRLHAHISPPIFLIEISQFPSSRRQYSLIYSYKDFICSTPAEINQGDSCRGSVKPMQNWPFLTYGDHQRFLSALTSLHLMYGEKPRLASANDSQIANH